MHGLTRPLVDCPKLPIVRWRLATLVIDMARCALKTQYIKVAIVGLPILDPASTPVPLDSEFQSKELVPKQSPLRDTI